MFEVEEMEAEVKRLEAKQWAVMAGHPEWGITCTFCGCGQLNTEANTCTACSKIP